MNIHSFIKIGPWVSVNFFVLTTPYACQDLK